MFTKRQSATPPQVLHFSVSDGAELCLEDMDQVAVTSSFWTVFQIKNCYENGRKHAS